MGIVLKVTPDILIRTSEDIEKQISDIQNQFHSIETEINRTRLFWEGDACDTHKNSYDSLKDEINEAVQRLKNHPRNLLQMAGLYSETEARLEEVALSLDENVIV